MKTCPRCSGSGMVDQLTLIRGQLIGTSLKAARLQARMTQDDLAEKCQSSRGSIMQMERNTRRASKAMIRRLEIGLGLPEGALKPEPRGRAFYD